MAKTAKTEGEAPSNDQAIAKQETASGEAPGLALSAIASLGLSQATVEKLALELKEKLHSATIGLDDRVKAGKIMERGDQFMIIDAFTVVDYLDKSSGEVSDKHVFVLEFLQGDVSAIMQSTTGPRKEIADIFQLARALGGKALMGPYKMEEKNTGKPQPALIFARQPGFKAAVSNA